jgi:hypothetical protein
MPDLAEKLPSYFSDLETVHGTWLVLIQGKTPNDPDSNVSLTRPILNTKSFSNMYGVHRSELDTVM